MEFKEINSNIKRGLNPDLKNWILTGKKQILLKREEFIFGLLCTDPFTKAVLFAICISKQSSKIQLRCEGLSC